MKTWILSWMDFLRGAFWFVPLVMVAGAVGLSFLTLALDASAAQRGVNLSLGWTFTRGPEGSRALLSTVAGSMITIASVCFSITVVALQQASSQFGPRLLHSFMRDRGNQVVLGTFIATFTYCLLVLRSVNGTDQGLFVPHLSVTVGLVLALAGVGVLIYFIHHAASSLQAEQVIAGVGADLEEAILRLYPSHVGEDAKERDTYPALPPRFADEAVFVVADVSDYLQAVDGEELMKIAVKHDLILRLRRRPGQFVLDGNPLLEAWPLARVTEDATKALRKAFYLGSRRSLLQDVEFAIDQLVEVALRALSPGINDPFTAMTCIDRLGAMICKIAGRSLSSPYRVDEEGQLRVVAHGITPQGVTDAAFHQIRQAARTNAAVTLTLLKTLAAVAPQTRETPFREPLITHARLVYEGSAEGLAAEFDRAAAEKIFETVIKDFGPLIAR